jgi:hypothetical protein
MPEGFEPVGDFALSEQTSSEPVHRFNRIVAAMLLGPPGIIVQWFVIKIAAATMAAPTIIEMDCPIFRFFRHSGVSW